MINLHLWHFPDHCIYRCRAGIYGLAGKMPCDRCPANIGNGKDVDIQDNTLVGSKVKTRGKGIRVKRNTALKSEIDVDVLKTSKCVTNPI